MKIALSFLTGFFVLLSHSVWAVSSFSSEFKIVPPPEVRNQFYDVTVKVELAELTQQETLEKIGSLKTTPQESLLIAAEHADVLQAAIKKAHSINLNQNMTAAFVLPLGAHWLNKHSLKIKNSLGQKLLTAKNFFKNLPQVAKKDRMGLAIATIAFGGEIFTTVTSGELSTVEASANILLSAALGIIFLDKEVFPKIVQPIKSHIRNLLNSSDVPINKNSLKELGITFAANLTIMEVLQYTRAVLVNIEHLDRFYSAQALAMPAFIALTSTFSGFGLSEANALVNETQYPKAKKYFRFFLNFRSIVLGWAAANVMLYHPDVYGIGPWIALGSFGAAGVLVYKKAESLRDFIEHGSIEKHFPQLPTKAVIRGKWNKINSGIAPTLMTCKEAAR